MPRFAVIVLSLVVNLTTVLAAVDDCLQSEKIRCVANGDPARCAGLGCHFCPDQKPKCVEGAVCKVRPIPEDNCWAGEPGKENSKDCLEKYGCSWCKNNVFIKCVKDTALERPAVDDCAQTRAERINCPSNLNRTTCALQGCHFCRSGKPRCIEGLACKKENPTVNDNCWLGESGKENAEDCLKLYGCSWCKRNENIKCVKDDVVSTGPPPTTPTQPSVSQCEQSKEDRLFCYAAGSNMEQKAENCRKRGCFWCLGSRPRCMEGKQCSQYPVRNCWPPSDTDTPTPELCREKYNGAWCSTPGVCACANPVCEEPDPLTCFPFPVTKDECLTDNFCTYCSRPSTRKRKCLREFCPEGWKRRYKSSSCCRDDTESRIIGGVEADPEQWPWMVALYGDGRFKCGGFLVDELHVVSAAHCYKDDAEILTVMIGTHDRMSPDARFLFVEKAVLADNYGSPQQYDNDIMVLELTEEVEEAPNVMWVNLPHQEITPEGMKCFTTGWGVTVENDETTVSDLLREVDVEILPFTICETAYGQSSEITPDASRMICAGVLEGGKDSCQGDSGGPLVCQRCKSCAWYVAGVVSYGSGCAQQGLPGVYTRVVHYESFLFASGVTERQEKHDCDLFDLD